MGEQNVEEYLGTLIIVAVALVVLGMYFYREVPEAFREIFRDAFLKSISYQDLLLDELLTKMLEVKDLKEAVEPNGDPFSPVVLHALRAALLEESLANLPLVRVRLVFFTKMWCTNWQPRIDRLHENMAVLYQPKTGMHGVVLGHGGGIFTTVGINFDESHEEIEITGIPDLISYRHLLALLHEAHVAVIITRKPSGIRRSPPKEKEASKSLLPGFVPA